MSDENLSSLTSQLQALRPRVAAHWQDYIDARLAAESTDDDTEPLVRCLEWVTRYATVDGVQGDGWDGRYYVPFVHDDDKPKAKPKRGKK